MTHDEIRLPGRSPVPGGRPPGTGPTLRVVHIIDSLGRSGGAEQQLVANLHHFSDPGLSHEVLCLYRAGTSREKDLPPGVKLGYLLKDGRRIRNRLVLSVLMRRRLAAMRPDLIHCVLPDAALASRIAGRWLRIPVIESLVNIGHEDMRIVDSPAVTKWKLAMHRFLDRATMRRVVRFHALSNEVARSWVDTVGISSARIVVIPRGVEVPEGAAGERNLHRRRLLEELGLKKDAFIILNVGRQVAQKGQIYAVTALALILEQVPEAVLVSAGSSGAMSERLRTEAIRLGVAEQIRWLGVREDVPELMAAADVFVFPSLYEGLGVSLLQAMASGLASIATDRPPMTEVIRDGENGLLVPARDPGAVAAAIIRLASDERLRASLSRNARSHVAEHFNSVEVAARTEQLYKDCLNAPTS